MTNARVAKAGPRLALSCSLFPSLSRSECSALKTASRKIGTFPRGRGWLGSSPAVPGMYKGLPCPPLPLRTERFLYRAFLSICKGTKRISRFCGTFVNTRELTPSGCVLWSFHRHHLFNCFELFVLNPNSPPALRGRSRLSRCFVVTAEKTEVSDALLGPNPAAVTTQPPSPVSGGSAITVN